MGIRVCWCSLPHQVVKVFSCHIVADLQLLPHFLLLFSALLLLSIDCFYARISQSRKRSFDWPSQSPRLPFEKSFPCEATSWVAGLMKTANPGVSYHYHCQLSLVQSAGPRVGQFFLGGKLVWGRYWMNCPREELCSNLAIIYWWIMGRNIFSPSSF